MSINIIREQLTEFLKSEEPAVLAIRGPWGIGKTYTWNQILKEPGTKIACTAYSYISLFGINSIQELKSLIFQNVIKTKSINDEPNVETFQKHFNSAVSFGRKWSDILKGIPAMDGFGHLIDSATFMSVRKMIICFDDFERKGEKLKFREVLGLVSVLKEQKKCKIVLIFNDEAFDTDANEYKKFREKVIDIELFLDLSPMESCELVFNKKNIAHAKLIEFCAKLKINNIRILKKIDSLSNLVEKHINENYEPEVLTQALCSLCLFCFCFYQHDKNIPTFEFLKNIDNPTDEATKKKWNLFLYDYYNTTITSLDLVIANMVEHGYINNQLFISEIDRINAEIIYFKKNKSLSESWGIYSGNFDDNEEEVIASFNKSFYEHYEFIDPVNLAEMVSIFRYLGRDDLADKMIDFYVDNRKNEKGLFDLKSNHFACKITDKKIIDSFRRVISEGVITKTVKEVIESIDNKKGWSREEVDLLSSASVEEYYELFKNEKNPRLISFVGICFNFETTNYAIANNAKEALKKIARENRLNARRVVELYGVTID